MKLKTKFVIAGYLALSVFSGILVYFGDHLWVRYYTAYAIALAGATVGFWENEK